jgi:FdhD protein
VSSDRGTRIPPGAADVEWPIVRVRGDDVAGGEDRVTVEEPLEIRLGGTSLVVTMRTPGHDEELVAGFLFSEGIITSADDLDVVAHYRGPDDEHGPGNIVNVILKGNARVARERLRRNLVASSSCGLCGKVTIEAIQAELPPVTSDVVVSTGLFHQLERTMAAAQTTFEKTGGLHGAGLFDTDGRLLVLREDIGRHNAVDKAIGHMLLQRRWPLDRLILMVSGRVSFEIMQKALVARIPVVAAVSAPSSMAVQLAEAAGMTLVAFVRRNGFNIYAGGHRVVPGAVGTP